MLKLGTFIVFATTVVLAWSAHLSDGVKEFLFTKTEDGSNEYDFE